MDKETYLELTFIPPGFDNRIVEEYRWSTDDPYISWEKFCKLKHRKLTDKHKAGLILPVTFKTEEDGTLTDTNPDGYEPAVYTDRDEVRTEGRVKECQPKINPESKLPYVGKYGDNVKKWYMLPVDVDGGMSIEEFCEKYQDWEFFLYTSWSHKTLKKEGKHCYRVFFILKRPCSHKKFLTKRKSIKEFFTLGENGIDKTSLDSARGFYSPSYDGSIRPIRIHNNFETKRIDIEDFATEKGFQNVIDPTEIRLELKDDDKAKLLEQLRRHYYGSYDPWYKIGIALYNLGYSVEDFIWVTRRSMDGEGNIVGLMKDKSVSDCKRQWKTGARSKSSIGLDYLRYLLRNEGEDVKWMGDKRTIAAHTILREFGE
jgi:hypothetical protein